MIDEGSVDEGAGQQPEYELTDLQDQRHAEQKPEYELVDNRPPGPDDQVIAREDARQHGIERSWLLRTFISVFVVVVIADIVLSAILPAMVWSQAQPEIDYVRDSMFAGVLIIVGYYFGERKGR